MAYLCHIYKVVELYSTVGLQLVHILHRYYDGIMGDMCDCSMNVCQYYGARRGRLD